MATLTEKIKCERNAREMLRRGGLPDPDRVEYGHTCIRLFWEQSKVVLVVDIDEPPSDFDVVGEYLEDLDLEGGDEDPDDVDFDDVVEELRRLRPNQDEEEAA